jgi:hypothetical protein
MLYNYTATELQPTVSATLNTLDHIYEITIEGEMREKSFISTTPFLFGNLRKRRRREEEEEEEEFCNHFAASRLSFTSSNKPCPGMKRPIREEQGMRKEVFGPLVFKDKNELQRLLVLFI